MIREAVGVFDNPEQLNAAVAELEVTAFPRDAISVLGTANALKAEFGLPYVRPEAAEDNPDAPRDILVRPEEKTIGVAAAVGLALYGGFAGTIVLLGYPQGLAGYAAILAIGAVVALLAFVIAQALIARFHGERDRQIRAGGLVWWVRTPDREQEEVAQSILDKHGARDIHIHAVN